MRVLVILTFLMPVSLFSQEVRTIKHTPPSGNSINYFLKLYGQSGGTLAPDFAEVNHCIRRLESKRSSFKTEKAFLHHIFVKTHQTFLSSFKPYASFSDLISDGDYNCLTATALYGIILDHFAIDYAIIESNDHIFIRCRTDRSDVLLETTDYETGFIDSPVGIEKKMHSYTRRSIQQTRNGKEYTYSRPFMDTVSLTGMLGLLHYNHAALAYNRHDYNAAIAHLHHGFLLHHSPRMEEFANVLLMTIRNMKMMNPSLKEAYIEKIQALRRHRFRNVNLTRS